jgi:hypothetical protein
MQAVAAELSGYAGKFRCFLERRVQKQFVFDSLILKHALKQTRSVCLRAF